MLRRLVLAVVLAFTATSLVAAPVCSAFEIALQDDPVFVEHRLLETDVAYRAAAGLHAGWLRVNVPWASAEGPAGLDLSRWDRTVAEAAGHGMRVQMTVMGPAPSTATADHRVGTLRPDADAFGRFAGAVAAHFRGAVERYSIWNEPNWGSYLRPRRQAAGQYRRLYAAGWRAIKRADPAAQVLLGELAPYGRPDPAIPPLGFLRAMLCSGCAPLQTDGVAVHPYTLRWSPTYPGRTRDDVTLGSLPRLERLLNSQARRGALRTPSGGAPALYLTEYGYPAHGRSVPSNLQAPLLAAAWRIAAHDRHVREMTQYQLVADPGHSAWDTSLLDASGAQRPAYLALAGVTRALAPARAVVRAPVSAWAARGGWSVPQTLGRLPRYCCSRVAAATAGQHTSVAWAANTVIATAEGHGHHRFGAPRVLTRTAATGEQTPVIARNARGDTLVAWLYNNQSSLPDPYDRDDGCCLRLAVRIRHAGRARFGPRQVLSAPRTDAGDVVAAVAPNGRAAIAWRETNRRARLVTARAEQRFGRPTTLTRSAVHVLGVQVSRRGSTRVQWTTATSIAGHEVTTLRERTRSANGHLGRARTLTKATFPAGLLLAADTRGNLLIAAAEPHSLAIARRPVGHRPGPFRTVLQTPADTILGPTALALSDDGWATIAAEQSLFTKSQVALVAATAAPHRGFRATQRLLGPRTAVPAIALALDTATHGRGTLAVINGIPGGAFIPGSTRTYAATATHGRFGRPTPLPTAEPDVVAIPAAAAGPHFSRVIVPTLTSLQAVARQR